MYILFKRTVSVNQKLRYYSYGSQYFNRMKNEIEDRKRETETLKQLLHDENTERIKDSETIQNRMLKEKEEIEEYLKHLDEVTEELGQDIDKLANDMKMGLEEEKMLRGQDIGILKFNLTEGLDETKGHLNEHKEEIAKI